MYLLIPILILLGVPVILLAVRLWRPRISFFWLALALAALLAWLAVLLLRLRLPLEVRLLNWQPDALLGASPTLQLDYTSWPFALALVTLLLAVLLTSVVRAAQTNPGAPQWLSAGWSAWASSMLLTGLGLVAVLAGNPLTLLLGWTALDLSEVGIMLYLNQDGDQTDRILAAFSARLAGTLLGAWAVVAARGVGAGQGFSDLPSQVSIFLLLAAGLRLGVLPLQVPFRNELPMRRGLGTMLRLVPAASSLLLLARLESGAPQAAAPYLYLFSALAALYACLSWATASDELAGRPYWILGVAAFAVAGAVIAQPAASLAWAMVLLLPGGLLFLTSARPRSLLVVEAAGLLGLTTLPYTQAWNGVLIYPQPFNAAGIIFLLAQALLIAGYARHALRREPPAGGAERWVWLLYPLGLVLLPLAHFIIAFLAQPRSSGASAAAFVTPPLGASWPGLAALALVGLIALARQRGLRVPARLIAGVRGVFSLEWVYRLLWGLYRLTGRGLTLANLVLEGEGGILWSLLLLVLLFSLIVQRGLGG